MELILEFQNFRFGTENFRENGSKVVGKMMQDAETKRKERNGISRSYGQRQQGKKKENLKNKERMKRGTTRVREKELKADKFV